MSPLRSKLDAARDAYRAASYPGDLAAEVLGVAGAGLAGPERSRGRWRVVLAVGAGVAAAVAAVVTIVALVHGPGGVGSLKGTGREGVEVAAGFEMPGRPEMPVNPGMPEGRPEMPAGVAVVPPDVDLTEAPGMPEFPSRFAAATTTEAEW